MDKKAEKRLVNIVGKEHALSDSAERLCYSYDGTFYRGTPDLVLFPQNAAEIAAIMKIANEEKIPVYPRGAGTGLSGGAIANDGGLVLVLTRMNRILEINDEDMLAVVEPGVVTDHLHRAVEAMGLFYPPDPASLKACTIGGNVAENAGGPRGFKYGVTADYILGLEFVSPEGKIIRTGGRTIKNVAGYHLIGLMAGSEGTLGIITEITLRLIKKPAALKTALLIYDDLDLAAKTVAATIREGIVPCTMELMDDLTIACVEKTKNLGLPQDAKAILLVECDGDESQVEVEMEKVVALARREGATAVETATDAKQRERLWLARRSSSAAIAHLNPTKFAEDITVPRSQIPAVLKALKAIAEEYDLKLPVFGHAGDGNLHPNIMADKENEEEMVRVKKGLDALFRVALDHQGTISGEHGIGISKKKYLTWQMGEEALAYMAQIKRGVDPNQILNPGKIF